MIHSNFDSVTNILKNQRGTYLIIFALALATILTIIGLGVDGGMMFLTSLNQQRAADTGALSGAYFIGAPDMDTQAIKTIALNIAQDNFQSNTAKFLPSANILATQFTVNYLPGVNSSAVQVTTNTPRDSWFVNRFSNGGSLGGSGPTTFNVGNTASASRSNVAVTLVLDTTASMNQPANSPYDNTPKIVLAKQAAKDFLARFNANDRVGLVSFSNWATVVESTNTAFNPFVLSAAIDNLNTWGATNIQSGLLVALDDILKVDSALYHDRVIVLVTDGTPNLNSRDHRNVGWVQVPTDDLALFPDFPSRSASPDCNGQDPVFRENFVEALMAADYIRSKGIKLLTVAIGPQESLENITEDNPFGTTPVLGSSAIRSNFMRRLAFDAEGAVAHSDIEASTSCYGNYQSFEVASPVTKSGISLINADGTALNSMLQQVANHITLKIVR